MKFIVKIVLSALAVVFLAWLLPGITIVDSYLYALLVAFTIGVLNALVRPVLIFLTLPATILSLGLFLLVINAFIIYIADWLLDDFNVQGFGWALLFSLLLSAINSIISNSLKSNRSHKKKQKVIIIEK